MSSSFFLKTTTPRSYPPPLLLRPHHWSQITSSSFSKFLSPKSLFSDSPNNNNDKPIEPLPERNPFQYRQKILHIPSSRVGVEILHDCWFNKGTAFSERERDRLRIRGLLPANIFTMEEQTHRAYLSFHRTGQSSVRDKEKGRQENIVAKHLFLNSLHDRNETLFFRLVVEHIEEMAPIIYTPTVGYACQHFSNLFRRPRGMFFSSKDSGDMHAIIENWPNPEVDVVVVTDGSRILGLGDLGSQGMPIPVGKLALYSAAGGIHPARCLPVLIDVGTNNEKLLNDPLYIGLRQRRLEGDAFISIIDEFMSAVSARFPNALIQFEDFRSPNAERLLRRYRKDYRMFNDDIQGTGAVALGGILSALRQLKMERNLPLESSKAKPSKEEFTKRKMADHPINPTELRNQRIVCVGAGSAGIGVCNAIVQGMICEGATPEEAFSRFWLIDDKGLVTKDRERKDPPHQPFVQNLRTEGFHDPSLHKDETGPLKNGSSLEEVVNKVKPTILLGLSGVGGLFTEKVIKGMKKHVHKPIIFAMSNPTDLAECTAEQVYHWTHGQVIFASGSPFAPVTLGLHPHDEPTTFHTSQANNMFIFPGVGLGIVSSGASNVTDSMFYVAAKELAYCTSHEDLQKGKIFPRISDIREVSKRVATAVAKQAEDEGLIDVLPSALVKARKEGYDQETADSYADRSWAWLVTQMMWWPEYMPAIQKPY